MITTDAGCFSGVCIAGLVGHSPTKTAVATAAREAVSCLLQQTSLVITNADVESAGCQPAYEEDM